MNDLSKKPRILILTKTIKSYWASDYANKRVTKIIEAKKSSIINLLYASLRGILQSNQYDLIICADPRIGTIYGVLRLMINSKTPVIIDQFILNDEKSIINSIKDKIYRLALRNIDCAIVNSSFEKEEYKRRLGAKNSFEFIPISAEQFWFQKVKSGLNESYIFVGGGEKRDFKSIIEIASRLDLKIIIVTFSRNNMKGIERIPSNCEIIYKLSNQEYIDMIGNSLFVVIPLVKTTKSAGQTTLVQAICQGKAIVVTDNPGVKDYIDGSALLYKSQDSKDLLAKINILLKSKETRERLENKSKQQAKKTYSYEVYDQKIGEIMAKYSQNNER